MMLTGTVAASSAPFPVEVDAHDGIEVAQVEVTSGVKPGENAVRVTVRDLPRAVVERGIRIVVRAEVLDPFSNTTIYPGFYDEWTSTVLAERASSFDLALPMSLSYFLAPISMTINAAAM